MKTIILAGGRGTRLEEETSNRPKPMVEIGGRPLLWHLMSLYAQHGFCEFLIACGYKGEMIKEYFQHFALQNGGDIVSAMGSSVEVVARAGADWRLGLIDTGIETMTGGRLRRLRPWIGEQTFMVTYGDGVGDIDITALVAFHQTHGKLATLTAVRPPARFGALTLEGDAVREFAEKPQTGEGWINGGFFVFEPALFDYLTGDATSLEREPLERLATEGQLMAFRHDGFWQPMDTVRERRLLEALWAAGNAPWKTWP